MSVPKESDVVILERDNITSCKIHLFGATLISWIHLGDELIFLSSKAKFDNKSAIRGGIPIIFPNFGPWDLGPQHGFARISRWTVQQPPKQDDSGKTVAILSLEDSEETRAMWKNHRFKLELMVTLSNSYLKLSLTVHNLGSANMDFTCLLHTYFRVPDVAKVTISGLKGLTYVDKAKDGKTVTEDREFVQIDGFVDSIYSDTPNEHHITRLTGGKAIIMQKENLPDTVVWNPWQEKAMQMADLGEDYKHMVCVEAGHVSRAVDLPPGDKYHASQTVHVVCSKPGRS